MNKRPLMAILGTTLLFSVGKVSVSYAQEQGTEPAASETASEKQNPSSKTDVPTDANVSGNAAGIGGKVRARSARDLDESSANPILGYRVACAAQRHHGGAFRDGPRFQ